MSGINITDCTPSFGSKNVIQKKCSTWNDVLRAHNLPARKDCDGYITSPRPLTFPIAKELRLAGYDVDYLRHLPEFQHWHDPNFGEEAFLHDTDLLNPSSATYVPLVYLFVRGPVDRDWYDKSPIAQHTQRQDELQKMIESKRRKISQNDLINETLEADVALHESELMRCRKRIERCQGLNAMHQR
jgi:hypothetical protein